MYSCEAKIVWNFLRKNCVEFPGVLVGLKFMKGVTKLCGVSGGEVLFCLEFPRVK